jgi:tetratricopeptide (TPR) repeat protein
MLWLQGQWSPLDAEAIGRQAHNFAMQGVDDEAESGYQAALAANPFAAAAWVARAELAETTGDDERALDMLTLARRLEPHTLRTEWALANTYLRGGSHDQAARHFGPLAASIPEMRVGIVDAAWSGGISPSDIAKTIVPPQGQAAGEFLNYLVRKKAWADLAPAYAAFDEPLKRSIPIKLMRYTFDQAFAASETQVYLDLWKQSPDAVDHAHSLLSIEHAGPPEAFGLGGYGLHWAVRLRRGVATQAGTSDGDPTSIEITFTEPQNLHYSHVARDFPVDPSRRYVLHAEVQAEEVTSSQGVRLVVIAPSGSLVESWPIRGTSDWSRVKLAFRPGPSDRVLRLSVARYPSETFDRDITGRFRLRNVRIVGPRGNLP